MNLLQKNYCFAGEQRTYEMSSVYLQGIAKFSVYIPPQAEKEKCPAIFFLAGLTCNEETFAIKAHAQNMASQLGLILVMPDTSPRGESVADDEAWDIGQGAGFYIDTQQMPWKTHFQMESYIVEELYAQLIKNFPIDARRIGIMGHSMGGHGALTLAWKYPNLFRSVSAFAPICAASECPWGEKVFSAYLGEDKDIWKNHDAVALVERQGALFSDVLIDQGLADQFYSQLQPEKLKAVCEKKGQPLTLRFHDHYDHGYYFVQSFIDDHLKFHFDHLNA
ncbi:S-formylglutathione hydrolase [Acinetobacter nectaris]|uniref:S-formylglutathione hydrolase n=1 Tax=Acinetobacter nectaris TaxID=1219382 RepID=UPI001F01AF52|nr:S-formylglutathione hydrolase [Acinetobacter nectaris]MCF9000033.1 S-formylglutathione hydrolase [Acinetobacter nectaris]MCF9028507.1 S-formylglutathione hydrolase [Acinetobacter nectaris]